jgi:hypothetical protein
MNHSLKASTLATHILGSRWLTPNIRIFKF